MPARVREIIGDYVGFLQYVDDGLEQLGIERDEISMIDHICYRVESEERYKEMRERCTEIGTLVGESDINGRLIATFEFNEYLTAAGWTVPYLELPAPKAGSPYKEGLEHAEMVVVGSLDQFAKRHADLAFTSAGMGKSINPELGLKQDGLSVKFHEQQLGAVVRIEKQLGITKVDQS
jgi:predicted metalloenzyme YecM